MIRRRYTSGMYEIRRALAEDLPLLPDIERRAAVLLAGQNLPTSVLEETTPHEKFREAMQHGLLWAAVDEAGQPVGFAHAESHGEALHLAELDVIPEHGRKGLGRRLVETVCRCAHERGFAEVTLTTFRDLPFNAPFYERLGFEPVPSDALTPILVAIVKDETQRGLPAERRVVMRRRV